MNDEEVMAAATHILDALFVGKETTGLGTVLTFKPVAAIKGVLAQEEQLIHVLPASPDGSDNYVQNGKYMLFLERNQSVYYDYDLFVQLGEKALPEQDASWDAYHVKARTIAEQTAAITPAVYGVPYSKDTELEAVIGFSSNIFVVNVMDVYAESDITSTTVYNCRVTQVIKGEPDPDRSILITLFNDSVRVGEDYLMLLADAAKTEPVYTLSSRQNSVFTIAEAESITSLEQLLQQAIPFEQNPVFDKGDDELLEKENAAENSN
ncbi:MAG: hypothetical protein IJM90_04085 [Firmicutes bacterium]|nr:hypothetical protein [Bacillota bacterium]